MSKRNLEAKAECAKQALLLKVNASYHRENLVEMEEITLYSFEFQGLFSDLDKAVEQVRAKHAHLKKEHDEKIAVVIDERREIATPTFLEPFGAAQDHPEMHSST